VGDLTVSELVLDGNKRENGDDVASCSNNGNYAAVSAMHPNNTPPIMGLIIMRTD
jgi:hypothetical protein